MCLRPTHGGEQGDECVSISSHYPSGKVSLGGGNLPAQVNARQLPQQPVTESMKLRPTSCHITPMRCLSKPVQNCLLSDGQCNIESQGELKKCAQVSDHRYH